MRRLLIVTLAEAMSHCGYSLLQPPSIHSVASSSPPHKEKASTMPSLSARVILWLASKGILLAFQEGKRLAAAVSHNTCVSPPCETVLLMRPVAPKLAATSKVRLVSILLEP